MAETVLLHPMRAAEDGEQKRREAASRERESETDRVAEQLRIGVRAQIVHLRHRGGLRPHSGEHAHARTQPPTHRCMRALLSMMSARGPLGGGAIVRALEAQRVSAMRPRTQAFPFVRRPPSLIHVYPSEYVNKYGLNA